jgi:tetratricopeptide (TPR) repeat protein
MNPQIGFLLNKSLESLRGSNIELAELYLKQAIRLQSTNPHVLRLLGVISAQRKDYAKALDYLNHSLKYLPKNPQALSNLGNVFLELKDYQNAIDAYDQCIKIDPNYEEVWYNKGNVLYEIDRYEEAISHYDRALSLKPGYVEAYTNKGSALNQLKRFEEAISHYDMALSLKPDDHEASWNKSLSLLLQGNFENGLPLYESRWHSKVGETLGRRSFDGPIWRGVEPLQGKTILLYGEQGLGDFIQFCRYAKLIAELGAKVILEAPGALAGLLKNLEGVSQLLIRGEGLPFFDYQCSLLSLPLAFQTNLYTIPNGGVYLNLDSHPDKIVEWQTRVGLKLKPRAGLVWSGNYHHKNDHNRSLLLIDVLPYLPAQFEYISLQKDIHEVDKLTLHSNPQILDFADDLNDFVDTAALIDGLDLVISVDTSVAHLSGALGKKTLVLIPYIPDWRWLLERDDSPWYPSMRLYRQSAMGDWSSALNRLKFDLSDG